MLPSVSSKIALNFRQRAWASLTGPTLAKEDPSTDIQEDSTANKSALEDSKKKAEDADGVTRGKQGGGGSATVFGNWPATFWWHSLVWNCRSVYSAPRTPL